jgi:hypothetical protein
MWTFTNWRKYKLQNPLNNPIQTNIQATEERKHRQIINIEILKIIYAEALAFSDRGGDIYIYI